MPFADLYKNIMKIKWVMINKDLFDWLINLNFPLLLFYIFSVGLFQRKDQAGSPLTSVSAVARVMPLSVLSLMKCEGYVCVSPIQGDTMYQKSTLEPGVYGIKDIVEDDIVVHLGANKTKKTKLVRCLRYV